MRDRLRIYYKKTYVDGRVINKLEKVILNEGLISIGELTNGHLPGCIPSLYELKERFNLECIEY